VLQNKGMLSILIPTRDYTCYQLVADLHNQAEELGIPYEILVAEDGSRSQVSIIANHKIEELSHCHHLIRKENVGRSAIRNVLIDASKGNVLLLMDADGKVVRKDFLQRYWQAGQTHDVVCGGIQTPNTCPDPTRTLRWKYEKAYEAQHGCISEQFRSFCFLISRQVTDQVRFDERYRHYGFEDVQFGLDLKAAGYTITSIDNPLGNKDFETNAIFIEKTEEALRAAFQFRHDIGEHITLTRIYDKYKAWGWALRGGFRILRPLLRRNLLSTQPSLFLFSVYKLGYYATLKGQEP